MQEQQGLELVKNKIQCRSKVRGFLCKNKCVQCKYKQQIFQNVYYCRIWKHDFCNKGCHFNANCRAFIQFNLNKLSASVPVFFLQITNSLLMAEISKLNTKIPLNSLV